MLLSLETPGTSGAVYFLFMLRHLNQFLHFYRKRIVDPNIGYWPCSLLIICIGLETLL